MAIQEEISALRSEMRELKNCQLRYFSLAVLAAGAILGTNGVFGQPDGRGLVVLAPLLVIIPCWLTFFDKATTITRIAAYVRLLEERLAAGTTAIRYVGFETALRDFRQYEDRNGPRGYIRLRNVSRWLQHVKLLALRTRHRYWALNWWTFFLLAWVCCVLPFGLGVHWIPFVDARVWTVYVSIAVVFFATLLTFSMLINLHAGSYSYDEYEAVWRQVLKQNSPSNDGLQPTAAGETMSRRG
jgi:hypothetical protein